MVSFVMYLLATATPWLPPLLAWLAPLLWVVWALVMVLLLAIAVAGHLLVGKLRPANSPR